MFTAQFLLTALVVVLIPGTGALYTISTGIARGSRVGVAAAFGCTIGIVPHLLASALGLSAIINMGAQVFSGVKLAGACYLLYLAWQTWKEAGRFSAQGDTVERGLAEVAWRGVALNLLNPKLTIFFLAFLPNFITPGSSAMQQLAGLSAVFMVMTFVVFSLYAVIASAARLIFSGTSQAMRWLQRSFAVVFAGLAVELALSDR
ncbi:MAG: LysE family translocator [Coriobacteriia bacterium]|nr:LysE family translocator [Coriobacteriia bacterium]